MTHMLQEIHDQPGVLERLCDEEDARIGDVYQAMLERGIENISIVARGTSDNAGTYGKYVIEIMSDHVVSMAAPSVLTLYKSTLNLSKWLTLGISQSGESTDVVAVIERAKELGALTVGITNVRGSSLTKTADFTLLCHAGEEKSVAATKTYTATAGLLYLLAGKVAQKPDCLNDLKTAAHAIRSIFDTESRIERVVERYRYMQECMVIARGINQATSQETALKLLETCYVVAKPYSSADFQHGPIATIDEGFPVFLYAVPGKAYQSVIELMEMIQEDRAETIVISSVDEVLSRATTPIEIPVEVDEMLSPLVYIVVGQLFAQYLSLTKGYNPDQPRGLTKVTRTM